MKQPLPCRTLFEESSLRGPIRGPRQSLRCDDRLLRCARNDSSHLKCDQPAGHGTNPTRKAGRPVQDGRQGFVLVLVVLLIAVMGAEMFVLGGLSRNMLFESDSAYLEAAERDLALTGLAWAKGNIGRQNSEAFARKTELDTAKMGISDASLSVVPGVPQDGAAEVEVNTSCSRSGRVLTRSHTYSVNLSATASR
jgi:hypothetical protein